MFLWKTPRVSRTKLHSSMLRHLILAGCFACTFHIMFLCWPWPNLFAYHPSLMTLAFTCLMVESSLIFTQDGLASGALHKTKVFYHWLLLLSSLVIAGAGFAVIYYNKELHNKPHFTSWHGTLGLAAFICLSIQVSMGVTAKYPLYFKRFIAFKVIRTTHAVFGVCTFIIGMMAIKLGFLSNWYANNGTTLVMYLAIAYHSFLIYRVSYHVINKYVRNIK